MQRKYSVGLWFWGKLSDRFATAGYRDALNAFEAIKEAKKIPNVSGVELTYPDDVNDENWRAIRDALAEQGLQVASIYCNLSSDRKWSKGAFTATATLRKQALDQVKRTMDLAAELEARRITFSLLQDGWDYPFEIDYAQARDNIIEGLQHCCDYRKDVTIGVEYKPREPRTFCFLSTAPLTLLLIKEINRENIGIVLDTGHALMARENLGDTVALIGRFGKLVHLHLNDNYRDWDDDLIVGSVHFLEMLELVYWLRRINYREWYGLDIFPYRENPSAAAAESIAFLETCQAVLDDIGMELVGEMLRESNPTETLKIIREKVFCRKI